MVTIQFPNGSTAKLPLDQVKIMACGKLTAPVSAMEMRQCEIISYEVCDD